MGATVQINESTSFVLNDGRLVAIEEASKIERDFSEERRNLSRSLAEDEQWKMVPDFVRDNDLPMFLSVSEYTLRQVQEWLRIRKENETDHSKKYLYQTLIDTIPESLLLERLVRGKGAFKDPPPKSYSHAWHDLVDYGEDVCIDCYFAKSYVQGEDQEIARIDGERWDIVERVGEESYVVQYHDNPKSPLYLLTRMTDEDYFRLMHPRMKKLADGKNRYSWKLTKLEEIEDGGE